jgi:hypothetical protein
MAATDAQQSSSSEKVHISIGVCKTLVTLYPQTSHTERNERLQAELMDIQSKYQREIEKLEKENKELKKQLLLRYEQTDPRRRHEKVSVFDENNSELCAEIFNRHVFRGARSVDRLRFVVQRSGQSAASCRRWRSKFRQDIRA